MKVIVLLAGALAISGCNVNRPSFASPVVIWTDADTGCQYLVAAGAGMWDWSDRGGSITPRLGANGQPMCGRAEAES